MRKIVFSFFVFTVLFVILAAGTKAYAVPFSDVQGHWASQSIINMNKKGFVQGYPDRTFGVKREITRAEFLTILVRVAEVEGATNPFADANSATWANANIGGAVRAGIIIPSEYPNNRFEPNKPITRLEMSRMIARALTLNEEYKNLLNTYRKLYNGDMVFTDWQQIQQKDVPYIALTFGALISQGYPDGSFGIERLTNRAEATVMLERFLNTKDKSPSSFQYLNEMQEVALTGTNARTVSSLEPRQEHFSGLEVDHFAFNFKTKRVYVIPFHDDKGKTSMYERKFIVDRELIYNNHPNFRNGSLFKGYIATVGEIKFKTNGIYYESFGTRLSSANGNFLTSNLPMQKFNLNYLDGSGSTNIIQQGSIGQVKDMVLYGTWTTNEFSRSLNLAVLQGDNIQLFVNRDAN